MTFYDFDNVELRELMPGFKVHFIHLENMSIAYWEIEKDSVLPQHTHPHEQVTNIIEGELELTIDDEVSVLTRGKIAVIKSNAVHSGKTITRCRIVEIFSPVREDFKALG